MRQPRRYAEFFFRKKKTFREATSEERMVLSSHSTSAPSRAPRRINDAHYCCPTRCGSSTEWRIHRTWRNLIDAAVRHRIALLWMMALMMVLLWLHMDDGASRGTRNKGSDYVAAVAAHG